MASSGTVTTPTIDFSYKPRARETVLLSGYARIKSAAVIEAGDLTLRTIKSFNITQYSMPDRPGALAVLFGSVQGRGSLMNSVTFAALRGSIVPHTGTQHVGTRRAGGTYQVSFIAIGA